MGCCGSKDERESGLTIAEVEPDDEPSGDESGSENSFYTARDIDESAKPDRDLPGKREMMNKYAPRDPVKAFRKRAKKLIAEKTAAWRAVHPVVPEDFTIRSCECSPTHTARGDRGHNAIQ